MTPMPPSASHRAVGQSRQASGSLRRTGARLSALRMQARRPERASQVAASGVGAMDSMARKPSSSSPLAMLCRSSRSPPNKRRLPAISSSRTSLPAIDTNEENRSAQVASPSRACCSRGRLRSSSCRTGSRASAALAACPGITPAACASGSASSTRWIPCWSSTTACGRWHPEGTLLAGDRTASSARCGNQIQNHSCGRRFACGRRLAGDLSLAASTRGASSGNTCCTPPSVGTASRGMAGGLQARDFITGVSG